MNPVQQRKMSEFVALILDTILSPALGETGKLRVVGKKSNCVTVGGQRPHSQQATGDVKPARDTRTSAARVVFVGRSFMHRIY